MKEEVMMNEGAQTNDIPDSSQYADQSPNTVLGVDSKEQLNHGEPASNNFDDQGEPRSGDSSDDTPDVYSFKNPEGLSIDNTVIDSFSEISKELGLSEAKAQKVIDKMAPAIADRQREQIKAAQNEWLKASQSDREFGGCNLNENLGVAKRAFETYSTPAFRQLLEETGLGNHPEVIRMFYRVGKTIGEDQFVGGGVGHQASGKSRADLIYDNTER